MDFIPSRLLSGERKRELSLMNDCHLRRCRIPPSMGRLLQIHTPAQWVWICATPPWQRSKAPLSPRQSHADRPCSRPSDRSTRQTCSDPPASMRVLSPPHTHTHTVRCWTCITHPCTNWILNTTTFLVMYSYTCHTHTHTCRRSHNAHVGHTLGSRA